MRLLGVLLLAAVVGCQDAAVTGPGGGPGQNGQLVPLPDAGAPGDLPPCDPALELAPLTPAVEPSGQTGFVAMGGTGAYRFAFVDPDTDGALSPLTGAFLAGAEPGSTVEVEVTDTGCLGEARARVQIVPRLRLVPNEVQTEPGSAWTFELEGGAGPFVFEMAQGDSGGAVSGDGAYQAGPRSGLDVVVVRDQGTGQSAEAEIRLQVGARFRPALETLMLPVGGQAPLRFDGGSRFFDLVQAPDFVEVVNGDRLEGLRAGAGVLEVRDRFTDRRAELTVVVVAPLAHQPRPSGDGLLANEVIAPGDLNGDGWDELLVAVPEHDGAFYNQGAVFLYRGTREGIERRPARSWSGRGRSEEFGRAVVVADVTGDGREDLIVGAPNRDGAGGTDAGGVSIFAGLPEGDFEAEASTRLAGRFSFDRFGFSLAACDFDGDGDLDLAVGARDAEDRSRRAIAFSQGEVALFTNRGGDFGVTPERSIYGDVPDGDGDWVGDGGMRFGEALGAGDFDGDGLCDLAVAAWRYDRPGSFDDGMLSIHLAEPGTGPSLRPHRLWRPDDPEDRGSHFGSALVVGDVNKDRLDDVLVTQPRFDAGEGDNHGAIRLFLGRPARELAQDFSNANEADWSVVGPDSGDQFGWRVAVGDRTGDGEPDVLVGSLYVEEEGAPGNSGSVQVFRGRGIGLLPETQPEERVAGTSANLQLGGSVALLKDRDADQRAELAVFAAGDDEAGLEVGAPLLFVSRSPSTPIRAELPAQAAGGRFGFGGAAVGDVNGDGFTDVVASAPYSPVDGLGRRSGMASLHLGSEAGVVSEPALVLEGFAGHRGFDLLGWDAAPAGDFDGDGKPDFAVVARFGDRPADPNGDGFELSGGPCEGGRFNRGAIFIWRGVSAGLPDPTPAFVIIGPQNQGIRSIAGGGDVNGDGFGDLAFGSSDWDAPGAGNAGGYALVTGRSASRARTRVICQAELVVLGRASGDGLGYGLTMGRLDDDACADVAAGAPFDDRVENNEGSIEVLHGWGGFGCPSEPARTIIRSGDPNAQFGRALGAGALGGARRDRLAVGAPYARIDGEARGQVVLLDIPSDGPRVPVGQRDTAAATRLAADLSPPVVRGETPGAEFGGSLAMLDGQLAVGAPLGQADEVAFSGATYLFRFDGPRILRSGLFVGEANAPTGGVGGTVRAFGSTLFIGGEFGASAGPDTGSAYAIQLP